MIKERKWVRASGRLASLLGVACLSVFASSEKSAFIIVEGDAEFRKDGDEVIVIHDPHGEDEVTVTTRDGWEFSDGTTSKQFSHKVGTTNVFDLVGRDGENWTRVEVRDDHAHHQTEKEDHVCTPIVEATSAPDEAVYLYAAPEVGVLCPTNSASWGIVTNGMHQITLTTDKCNVPGCNQSGRSATNDVPIVISVDQLEKTFTVVPSPVDGRLISGQYTFNYFARWADTNCIEQLCETFAATNSSANVFKMSVTNDLYIGLDMTDIGKTTNMVRNSWVEFQPEPSLGKYDITYEWVTRDLCGVTLNTMFSRECRYGTLSSAKYSQNLLDQVVECRTEISLKGSTANSSAIATNRFTVVKADVMIKMLDAKDEATNELQEEKYGAFVLYEKDYEEFDPFSPRGIDSLREVKFIIRPEKIPDSDTIEIEAPEKYLYEKEVKNNVTNYTPASPSYKYGELKNKMFVLHGHERSDALRDRQIKITHKESGAIDVAKFTVVEMDLVPDFDRNHKIDEKDVKKVAKKQMFYWWLNDDADEGDCANCFADKGTEIPGEGPIAAKNNMDAEVNGRTDLLDFFPLWTKLGHALKFCKETEKEKVAENKLTIGLKHIGLGYALTRLDTDSAGSFLVKDSRAIRENQHHLTPNADWLHEAIVHKMEKEDKDSLHEYYLEQIDNKDSKKGILMVEGADRTTDVRLELKRGGVTVLSVPFRCSIQSVLDMMNLIDFCDETPSFTEMKIKDKTFAPLDKDVLYLHGFKVKRQFALGWHAEAFKRLHQSGSEARFTGITWPGIVEDGMYSGLHYHECAEKAFVTAERLAMYVKTNDVLKLRSSTVYMAHSLGNMVVSSAIQDYGLQATHYFMLNGAVASEAYEVTQYSPFSGEARYLVFPAWRQEAEHHSGYPEETYCSAWYKLFQEDNGNSAAGQSRTNLTWKGRFGSVSSRTNMRNYYSPGDEVFEISTSAIFTQVSGSKCYFSPFDDYESAFANLFDYFDSDNSQFCWQKQEMGKGVAGFNMLRKSDMGGWGFNTKGIDLLAKYFGLFRLYSDNEDLWLLVNDSKSRAVLKDIPVFRNNPSSVFSNGPTPLSQNTINEMLCCAIPAVSTAMGRTAILNPTNMEQFQQGWGRTSNLMKEYREYGTRWLHCDIKDMAYFYTKGLWDRFVKDGHLKGAE